MLGMILYCFDASRVFSSCIIDFFKSLFESSSLYESEEESCMFFLTYRSALALASSTYNSVIVLYCLLTRWANPSFSRFNVFIESCKSRLCYENSSCYTATFLAAMDMEWSASSILPFSSLFYKYEKSLLTYFLSLVVNI